MMNLTRGREFPWRDGGVALLRRALYPDLGEWTYCGLAMGADTQIANYPGMTHSASQGYQYAAVQILGNGMVSAMCQPVRVDFDAEGDRITPGLPIFPINLAAAAIAGGKFRMVWEYDPFGQGADPADFQVFEGGDAESVDYETPLTDSETGLTTVPFVGTRRVFQFTTGAYDNHTAHVFGVRGRNVNEVAERNTYTTASKRARATAPTAAGSPQRMRVEPVSRLAM